MLWMSQKSDKKSSDAAYKTAGASVPVTLLSQFNSRANLLGQVKERAYAVAMMLYLEASDDEISELSKRVAAEYIKPLEAESATRSEALAADLDSQLKGRRSGAAPSAGESAVSQPARRRANG